MNFSGEFIKRLKEKDNAAFKELYAMTSVMVFNYILCRVKGRRETAEDILSDVYCDAILYSVSLTFTHNVEAWILRIAKSKIGDYYRKIAKERRIVAAQTVVVKEKSVLNDLSNHPESETLCKEHEHLLKAAFMRLSQDDRKILAEKYTDSKSVAEIAAGWGKTEKAIENILYRAKKSFQYELAKMTKEKIYFLTIVFIVWVLSQ
jgi:RNA polymerase sigma-70 factor (ECF subfamily)